MQEYAIRNDRSALSVSAKQTIRSVEHCDAIIYPSITLSRCRPPCVPTNLPSDMSASNNGQSYTRGISLSAGSHTHCSNDFP